MVGRGRSGRERLILIGGPLRKDVALGLDIPGHLVHGLGRRAEAQIAQAGDAHGQTRGVFLDAQGVEVVAVERLDRRVEQ